MEGSAYSASASEGDRRRRVLEALIEQQALKEREAATKRQRAAEERASMPIWKRDEERKRAKDAKLRLLAQSTTEAQLADCTFAPSISKKSRELQTTRRGIRSPTISAAAKMRRGSTGGGDGRNGGYAEGDDVDGIGGGVGGYGHHEFSFVSEQHNGGYDGGYGASFDSSFASASGGGVNAQLRTPSGIPRGRQSLGAPATVAPHQRSSMSMMASLLEESGAAAGLGGGYYPALPAANGSFSFAASSAVSAASASGLNGAAAAGNDALNTSHVSGSLGPLGPGNLQFAQQYQARYAYAGSSAQQQQQYIGGVGGDFTGLSSGAAAAAGNDGASVTSELSYAPVRAELVNAQLSAPVPPPPPPPPSGPVPTNVGRLDAAGSSAAAAQLASAAVGGAGGSAAARSRAASNASQLASHALAAAAAGGGADGRSRASSIIDGGGAAAAPGSGNNSHNSELDSAVAQALAALGLAPDGSGNSASTATPAVPSFAITPQHSAASSSSSATAPASAEGTAAGGGSIGSRRGSTAGQQQPPLSARSNASGADARGSSGGSVVGAGAGRSKSSGPAPRPPNRGHHSGSSSTAASSAASIGGGGGGGSTVPASVHQALASRLALLEYELTRVKAAQAAEIRRIHETYKASRLHVTSLTAYNPSSILFFIILLCPNNE